MIGSLVKTGVVESKASHNASAVHGSGRHLHLRSRSRLAIVVVVLLSSSSSLDKNIWCVEGVVPWGRTNYNDTTTKNLSEVTAVSLRYEESYQTRTSNAGYPNRTRTPFTNL